MASRSRSVGGGGLVGMPGGVGSPARTMLSKHIHSLIPHFSGFFHFNDHINDHILLLCRASGIKMDVGDWLVVVGILL